MRIQHKLVINTIVFLAFGLYIAGYEFGRLFIHGLY